MRGKFFAALVIGFVMLSSISFGATYGGGSGTAADPYQIWTPQQMNTIGANSIDWGKCFKLMTDIDMSAYTGTQYKIIGNETTKFTGTFDGNYYKISNLTYTTTAQVDYVGLFGCIQNATINNLGLENVSISTAGYTAGGLVAMIYGGTVSNCYCAGSVSSSLPSSSSLTYLANAVGGLVGNFNSGNITNCYSMGQVNSSCYYQSSAGGLAGTAYGFLRNCFSTCTVASNLASSSISYHSYAGGLVGNGGGTITNCYSTGNVKTSTTSSNSACYAGGLFGYFSGNMSNCYSMGLVTNSSSSSSYTGGLVGYIYHSNLSNSYSMSPVISSSYASSYAGGLAGYLGNANQVNQAKIEKCYSMGQVTGSIYKGGFLGGMGSNTIATACFWDNQTSGLTTSAGGTGLTTTQMKTQSTFTSSGWDFSTVWYKPINDYPQLKVLKVTIPNVTGMSKTQAQASILSAGLNIGTITYTFNGGIPAGNVINQSPVSGTSIGIAAPIDLVISSGVAITMPDVIGLSQEEAQSIILSAGLTFTTITSYHGSVPAGYVLSQTPCAGQSASPVISVNLIISLGKRYSGGNGTAADPFIIADANDLNTIGTRPEDWNKCFKLVADIDMSSYTGTQYNIIGNSTTSFVGTFDGNYFKISNLNYITGGTEQCVGFFGYISSATIKNLDIINMNISTQNASYAGGLVGYMESGTIIHCSSTGSISSLFEPSYVGGMVGCQYSGTINDSSSNCVITSRSVAGGFIGKMETGKAVNCSSSGTVFCSVVGGGFAGSGEGCSIRKSNSTCKVAPSSYPAAIGSYIGGFIGGLNGGDLAFCYSTGNVVGTYSSSMGSTYLGGLIGFHYGNTVANCYSTGNVSCPTAINSSYPSYEGGLVGYFYGSTNGSVIKNCYSTGTVTAANSSVRRGGLIGSCAVYNTTVLSSLWDTQTSGMTVGVGSGSSSGVTGKTTAEMKTQSTFTGWDFVNTWYMNGYPSLNWEINPLQTQIDAASNGATITVQPGLYQGRLYFKGKNITLTSTNPQDPNIVASTIIQGRSDGSVITFAGTETAACVLSGFTITGGNSTLNGGGVNGNDCYASIQNCRFYGNTAANVGGGIWGVHGPVEHCVVYNNTALYGGGIGRVYGPIRNCLIYGNQAPYASGLNNCDGAIQNCTIVSDQTVSLLRICDGTIQNCILQTPGPVFDTCTAAVSYTCLPGATGRGNISFNPMFADPVNHDYYLLPESPCMDAGNPASDYSLESMPNGGRIDMGAYGNTPQATLSRNVLTSLGFQIVSKTRTGRTLFEYELAVVVRNPNTYDMTNVQMKLRDWDAAVLSVSDDIITIDSIPAGATVTSTDTFKIVMDRSMLIVPGMLTWDIVYYEPAGQVQHGMMSMALSEIDAGTPGDISGDGKVNLDDFAILAGQWHTAPGTHSADIALPQDGHVGIEDLMLLVDNWMK